MLSGIIHDKHISPHGTSLFTVVCTTQTRYIISIDYFYLENSRKQSVTGFDSLPKALYIVGKVKKVAVASLPLVLNQ